MSLCSTSTPSTTQTSDRPTVVLVLGTEGAPEYLPQFQAWAAQWSAAASEAGARLVTLGAPDSPTQPSDKQKLQSLLAEESKDSTHPLWLVLIGHGTYDGRDAKFNLRGEDVSDKELAELLRPMTRPLAVINCTAASSPFLSRLSAQNRIVVTATRAGSEIEFAHFGGYLAASIADPAADLDKDGQTSLLEAFLAASHRTEDFYKQAGRLATEHALLDDNGDALGTPATFFQGIRAAKSARSGAPLDGHRAHQWHLLRSPEDQALPPDLRAKRDELELRIATLREKKPSLPEATYYQQLEPLLLDLARLYQSATTQPAAP